MPRILFILLAVAFVIIAALAVIGALSPAHGDTGWNGTFAPVTATLEN